MKTVTITEAFDGYPQAPREGAQCVSYAEGQEVEVNDTFADLIIGKGLAREVSATKATAKAEAAKPAPEQKDAAA